MRHAEMSLRAFVLIASLATTATGGAIEVPAVIELGELGPVEPLVVTFPAGIEGTPLDGSPMTVEMSFTDDEYIEVSASTQPGDVRFQLNVQFTPDASALPPGGFSGALLDRDGNELGSTGFTQAFGIPGSFTCILGFALPSARTEVYGVRFDLTLPTVGGGTLLDDLTLTGLASEEYDLAVRRTTPDLSLSPVVDLGPDGPSNPLVSTFDGGLTGTGLDGQILGADVSFVDAQRFALDAAGGPGEMVVGLVFLSSNEESLEIPFVFEAVLELSSGAELEGTPLSVGGGPGVFGYNVAFAVTDVTDPVVGVRFRVHLPDAETETLLAGMRVEVSATDQGRAVVVTSTVPTASESWGRLKGRYAPR